MIKEEIILQLKAGAKVKVYEGSNNTPFEGLLIARKHGSEIGATFTVRATVAGVGMEKVFPLHSPAINRVEVISSPKKVHRAKLYWVRKASGAKMRQRLGASV